MNKQNPHPTETPDQTPTGRPQVGWGFWALWVLALAAVGALSYCLSSFVPLSNYTLPPATIMTALLLLFPSSLSQTWAIEGLITVGAVCGATGGAITGAALVLQSRLPLSRVRVLPQDREMGNVEDKKLTNIAGGISGLTAAVLGTFVAPLVVTILTQGSLDSLDLTIFFFT